MSIYRQPGELVWSSQFVVVAMRSRQNEHGAGNPNGINYYRQDAQVSAGKEGLAVLDAGIYVYRYRLQDDDGFSFAKTLWYAANQF